MNPIIIVIILYLIVINFVGFFSMLSDKIKAKKRKWRTPEIALIIIAIIGGSIGSLIGMDVFHHKTKHKKFSVGIPLILLAQIIAIVLIWFKVFM